MKQILSKLVNGKGVFNFLLLIALNWTRLQDIFQDGEIDETERAQLEGMLIPIAGAKTELYITAICLVVAGVQMFKEAKI
jgi:hypothetical protein